MLDDHPYLLYTLLDSEYYETIDRYTPTEQYLSIVRARLTSAWALASHGFWTHCTPGGFRPLEHGWKIHVSSNPSFAIETLELVVPILVKAGVAFKFCSDPRMLSLSLNKNWPRAQAGKFVTVYPRSADEFRAVIDRLSNATRHLVGPHVLTDRPYRDSRVVYYRYGEHAGRARINTQGHRTRGYFLDDGTWHEDAREPTFRLPEGLHDPFTQAAEAQVPDEDGVLLKDRYRITSALKYNATGGIYVGRDEQTGIDVVIREIRGAFGADGGTESGSVELLQKEYEILQRLEGSGYAPRPVELFQEWQHWFLVQEKLHAESLWSHSMSFYFQRSGQTSREGFASIDTTIRRLAAGIEAVHSEGIVLRDLTRSNVMVEQGAIKFIDFEFAHDMKGGRPWVHAWTRGYATNEQMRNREPTIADDHYAFGVLILDILTFCAAGLELHRDGIFAKLKQNLADFGLPMSLYDIVVGLTDPDPGRRWSIAQALEVLDAIQIPEADRTMLPVGTELPDAEPPTRNQLEALSLLVSDIGEFLDAKADIHRDDRLWPASADVFMTNPVSLNFGAAGPAFFLLRARGHVETGILDWIEARATPARCAPGLTSGLAGVALLLLSSGRVERAEALIRQAGSATANGDYVPGLYFGAAGHGLVDLHFWRNTGKGEYLEHAIEIGERLLVESVPDKEGVYWRTGSSVGLGLAEGQTGIALFLTYLGIASNENRWLDAAAQALDFDIAHGVDKGGLLLWPAHVGAASGEPNSPHTWHGSAGVGTVALRCYAATAEPRFREVARRCAHAAATRFTNKLWQHHGIAGNGEFLLDMADFLQESRYRDVAAYQAQSLLLHQIPRERGVAFPGLDFVRICCDFGMGSAGIGVFLDRLLTAKPRLLMLDALFDKTSSVARSVRDGETRMEAETTT